MKRFSTLAALFLFTAITPLLLLTIIPSAKAIPQSFGGGQGFFGLNQRGDEWQPPANIEDMEDVILVAGRWDQDLPGKWVAQAGLSTDPIKVLTSPAKVFGLVPELVAARYNGSEVRSIYLQFADAGGYFGYTSRDELEKPGARKEIAQKQRNFNRAYDDIIKALEKELPKRTRARGKKRQVGNTTVLRSDYIDYDNGEVVVRLGASEGDYIYVEVMRSEEATHGYMDAAVAKMKRKDRIRALGSGVQREENGDTLVGDIPIFHQGSRPYCAINTLGMVTHHFGLRIPVNGLAASAGLKNTGSAKGSKIMEVYYAAAQEAGIKFMRSSKFEFDRARKALDAGYPVLVWRRYDANRDELHTQFAKLYAKQPGAELPTADSQEEINSWPGKGDPGHASIITGYNAERGEVIFLESWGEHTRNRRMRLEELEATAYMAFYFKL